MLSDYIKNVKKGQTIYVVGGGSSLDALDLSLLNGLDQQIIVCNTAFRLFPKALIAHHSDYAWFGKFGTELLTKASPRFITGLGLGTNQAHYPDTVIRLDFRRVPSISNDTSSICGVNSGYQAMMMAHWFEPRRIVLLGFDMMRSSNGRSHWAHHENLLMNERQDYLWSLAIREFEHFSKHQSDWWAAAGYRSLVPEVINVSSHSAIRCFPVHASLAQFVSY